MGLRPADLVGQRLAELIPGGAAGSPAPAVRRYLELGVRGLVGKAAVLDGRRRDGAIFPARARAVESGGGDAALYSLAVRDLDEQHRAQARLRL